MQSSLKATNILVDVSRSLPLSRLLSKVNNSIEMACVVLSPLTQKHDISHRKISQFIWICCKSFKLIRVNSGRLHSNTTTGLSHFKVLSTRAHMELVNNYGSGKPRPTRDLMNEYVLNCKDNG